MWEKSLRMAIVMMAWFLAVLLVPAIVPLNFTSFRISTLVVRTDYLVHVLIFTGLTFTLLWVNINIYNPLIFIILIVAGITAENVQIYIPHRSYNIYDLLSNLLGVVLGYALLAFVKFIRTTRRNQ